MLFTTSLFIPVYISVLSVITADEGPWTKKKKFCNNCQSAMMSMFALLVGGVRVGVREQRSKGTVG